MYKENTIFYTYVQNYLNKLLFNNIWGSIFQQSNK